MLSLLTSRVPFFITRCTFDTYVYALIGGAKVSGPVLTNDGTILLGDGRLATPGQLAAALSTGRQIPWPFARVRTI